MSLGFLIIAGALSLVMAIWVWAIWGRDITENIRIRLQQREHERAHREHVENVRRNLAREEARRAREEERRSRRAA